MTCLKHVFLSCNVRFGNCLKNPLQQLSNLQILPKKTDHSARYKQMSSAGSDIIFNFLMLHHQRHVFRICLNSKKSSQLKNASKLKSESKHDGKKFNFLGWKFNDFVGEKQEYCDKILQCTKYLYYGPSCSYSESVSFCLGQCPVIGSTLHYLLEIQKMRFSIPQFMGNFNICIMNN